MLDLITSPLLFMAEYELVWAADAQHWWPALAFVSPEAAARAAALDECAMAAPPTTLPAHTRLVLWPLHRAWAAVPETDVRPAYSATAT